MIRGLVVLLIFSIVSSLSAQKYDTVILGGRCISPELNDIWWYESNIGINADTIAIITPIDIHGKETVDATNLIVAPGFIDVLSDNTHNPLTTYIIVEEYKVTDGVTTALQMHGGTDDIEKFKHDYMAKPHWVNYGVSTNIIKVQWNNRASKRVDVIRKCLDDGALGISFSPEYFPVQTKDIMIEYSKIAHEYDVPVFIHTRFSSEENELDGVSEAIEIARESRAGVHIDHINSTGGTFNIGTALRLIQYAQDDGLNVTASVYPYTYWATYIHSTRFNDGWRERYNIDFKDLTVVGTGEKLSKESFSRYRKTKGVIAAVPEGAMSREDVLYPALRSDFIMISSDGGIESEPRANNHPRGAGAFSTAVRMGLDAGISLPTVVKKMTLDPAKLIGGEMMDRRGRLQEGMIADIVVFDADSINGMATVSNPNQHSKGIKYVLVGGKLTIANDTLRDKNGKFIRRLNRVLHKQESEN